MACAPFRASIARSPTSSARATKNIVSTMSQVREPAIFSAETRTGADRFGSRSIFLSWKRSSVITCFTANHSRWNAQPVRETWRHSSKWPKNFRGGYPVSFCLTKTARDHVTARSPNTRPIRTGVIWCFSMNTSTVKPAVAAAQAIKPAGQPWP